MDFTNISNGLNREEERPNVKVTIVALGGLDTKEVQAGMTVGEFKRINSLEGTKIVDEAGNTLENNAVISGDMQVFVSTPKKNG